MTSYLSDVAHVHESDAQVDGVAPPPDVDQGNAEEDDRGEQVDQQGEKTSPEQQRVEIVPLAVLIIV